MTDSAFATAGSVVFLVTLGHGADVNVDSSVLPQFGRCALCLPLTRCTNSNKPITTAIPQPARALGGITMMMQTRTVHRMARKLTVSLEFPSVHGPRFAAQLYFFRHPRYTGIKYER